jgi:hypothetical protein
LGRELDCPEGPVWPALLNWPRREEQRQDRYGHLGRSMLKVEFGGQAERGHHGTVALAKDPCCSGTAFTEGHLQAPRNQ